MDCPRCGGALSAYALGEAEAVACEDCGYLGAPVEHRPDPRGAESWEEAVARFRDREADGDG
jgi:DNA-directed RNA polymerase subunit M/transcription elongation factor TFIIS